ncbi:MAG: hypothetical protein NZZ41_06925 [Candidatus Dojkabacteria bacterium]|nr:hypothetical protein [Candidatus Dojkabacteria bacterium]
MKRLIAKEAMNIVKEISLIERKNASYDLLISFLHVKILDLYSRIYLFLL